MKILKALFNRFRYASDQAADAISDPAIDAKYNIEDAKNMVSDFTNKLATFMASNKSIERRLQKAKDDVIKWTALVEKAAQQGVKADVVQALRSKTNAEKDVVEFTKELERNNADAEKLRAQIQAVKTKIANAESNHTRLVAKQESAKIRKALSSASADLNSSSPIAALDEFEKLVQQQEDEASAIETLSESPDEQLESKYNIDDINLDSEADKLIASMASK